MLIAARNAILAGGGGWKNPYVTDGLIAMWDGEWNGGVGGTHDATIAKWKDLIGGLEFDNYGSGISFQSDCVKIEGNSSYLKRESSFVKPLILGNGDSAYFTIELCADPAAAAFSDVSFAEWIKISDTQLKIYGGNNGRYTTFWYSKGTLQYYENYNANRRTIAVVSNGTQSSIYTNGTYANAANNGSSIRWVDEWKLGGGKTAYWSGNIYAHRVYNRALTAAEIAANYAVDAQRFPLSAVS